MSVRVSYEKIFSFAQSSFKFLKDNSFLWECAQVFSILCKQIAGAGTPIPQSIAIDVLDTYHEIVQFCAAAKLDTIRPAELEDQLQYAICLVTANCALLSILSTSRSSLFPADNVTISKLTQQTQNLLLKLLGLTANSNPRGKYWMMLKRSMPISSTSNTPQRPSPIVGSTSKTTIYSTPHPEDSTTIGTRNPVNRRRESITQLPDIYQAFESVVVNNQVSQEGSGKQTRELSKQAEISSQEATQVHPAENTLVTEGCAPRSLLWQVGQPSFSASMIQTQFGRPGEAQIVLMRNINDRTTSLPSESIGDSQSIGLHIRNSIIGDATYPRSRLISGDGPAIQLSGQGFENKNARESKGVSWLGAASVGAAILCALRPATRRWALRTI